MTRSFDILFPEIKLMGDGGAGPIVPFSSHNDFGASTSVVVAVALVTSLAIGAEAL